MSKEIKRKKLKNGCVICTNYPKRKDGYYVIERDGKTWYLHRYLYYKRFGEIPSGKIIRHTCNNPSCINILHLKAGTQKDNIRDQIIAGTFVRGSKNGLSKLKEKDVFEIRKNKLSVKQVVEKYKISKGVAWSVVRNVTWKHVIV